MDIQSDFDRGAFRDCVLAHGLGAPTDAAYAWARQAFVSGKTYTELAQGAVAQGMVQCDLIFITDVRPGEPCLLDGKGHEDLTIRNLDGLPLLVLAPAQDAPWTHERLRDLDIEAFIGRRAIEAGVSAYIGGDFVGSTEV